MTTTDCTGQITMQSLEALVSDQSVVSNRLITKGSLGSEPPPGKIFASLEKMCWI